MTASRSAASLDDDLLNCPVGGSRSAAPTAGWWWWCRTRRPCGRAADLLDLDQISGLAVQDVAQRGEGIHAQPLRRLGDQPETCSRDRSMPRSASSGTSLRCGIGPLGHPQPQVPVDAHLADHRASSSCHRSPCRACSARVSSRLRNSSRPLTAQSDIRTVRMPGSGARVEWSVRPAGLPAPVVSAAEGQDRESRRPVPLP